MPIARRVLDSFCLPVVISVLMFAKSDPGFIVMGSDLNVIFMVITAVSLDRWLIKPSGGIFLWAISTRCHPENCIL